MLEDEPGMLQPGQLVGDSTYRIIRPLGKGGMGAVYLAANTKAFDRTCVVKEIIEYYDPTDPQARKKAIERFEAEARTLAELKHSGIPDIYAYFSQGGRNYLVMEYIEGPNLAQGLTHRQDGGLVQGAPQPLERVIDQTIQVCEVLVYLEQHQPPVVHNDIKPANIILDEHTGRAVLVDFGTARTRYASADVGRPERQQSSVYGTVGYAAPELYEGEAEPRSDVYALAATAYHLLTDDDPREHPFRFPKMDDIPEPVRQVLLEALQVDVSKRLSAAQFGERLKQTFDVPGRPSPDLQFRVLSRRIEYDGVEGKGGAPLIRIANDGSQRLQGALISSEPWLTVEPQFQCAPGQIQELKVSIDMGHLVAGQTHRAQVQVKVGGQEDSIPVVARVPPPQVDITPMQIDLGVVSRSKMLTRTASFKVHNRGPSRADCRIEGYPSWLILDPLRFTCRPGQTQVVELAGRVDMVPAGQDTHSVTLQVEIEGRHPRQVQVTLETRSGAGRIVSLAAVGFAVLVLLGAIVWFIVTVLPLIA
jgi:serine/threonine protein kinase